MSHAADQIATPWLMCHRHKPGNLRTVVRNVAKKKKTKKKTIRLNMVAYFTESIITTTAGSSIYVRTVVSAVSHRVISHLMRSGYGRRSAQRGGLCKHSHRTSDSSPIPKPHAKHSSLPERSFLRLRWPIRSAVMLLQPFGQTSIYISYPPASDISFMPKSRA